MIALWGNFGAHEGMRWARVAWRQCLADVDGHGGLGGVVKDECWRQVQAKRAAERCAQLNRAPASRAPPVGWAMTK